MEDPEVRIKAMTLFRNTLGNIPVLFTIRTSVEGGMLEIDTETYTKTILAVIDSGLIDLVDVELSRGEDTMKTLVAAAHRVGVKLSPPPRLHGNTGQKHHREQSLPDAVSRCRHRKIRSYAPV